MTLPTRLSNLTPLHAGLLAFAVAIASAVAPALASTASNTTITNTATVNYSDEGGTPQTPVSASAAITVTLVPSGPLLSSPTVAPISQGGTATLTYTITGTANGPDTYALSSSVANGNSSPVTPTLPANISLGGTTLALPASSGNTSITVPYDGNPVNTNVNGTGLQVGSVILIGGNVYTIASITKNPGANTAVVGLSSAIAGNTVAAGTIVGEQKTFVETVPSGNVTAGSSGTQTVTTTATSTTSGGASTTQSPATVITVNKPTLTVTKLVSTDNGITFGATGNAPPGTSLIYKITATNTGASNATVVQFTDVVPEYLTYVVGSGRTATSAATAYSAAAALTESAAGYSFTPSTNTVNYNPGAPGGTVAGGGAVLVLFFRATIN